MPLVPLLDDVPQPPLPISDARDIGAVYTLAESEVLKNLRARVDELEARLRALGLIG